MTRDKEEKNTIINTVETELENNNIYNYWPANYRQKINLVEVVVNYYYSFYGVYYGVYDIQDVVNYVYWTCVYFIMNHYLLQRLYSKLNNEINDISDAKYITVCDGFCDSDSLFENTYRPYLTDYILVKINDYTFYITIESYDSQMKVNTKLATLVRDWYQNNDHDVSRLRFNLIFTKNGAQVRKSIGVKFIWEEIVKLIKWAEIVKLIEERQNRMNSSPLSETNINAIADTIYLRLARQSIFDTMFRKAFFYKNYDISQLVMNVLVYYYVLATHSMTAVKKYFEEPDCDYFYWACVYIICSHYMLKQLNEKVKDYISEHAINMTVPLLVSCAKDSVIQPASIKDDYFCMYKETGGNVAKYYICLNGVNPKTSIANEDFHAVFDLWYNSGKNIADITFDICGEPLNKQPAILVDNYFDVKAKNIFDIIKEKILEDK